MPPTPAQKPRRDGWDRDQGVKKPFYEQGYEKEGVGGAHLPKSSKRICRASSWTPQRWQRKSGLLPYDLGG
jgi:hypothetical protein